MSIKERIVADLTAAMKSGAKDRLSVLRMVKARILEAEVGMRGAKGRDYQLEDAETIQVLSSYAKQRRDSIESFRSAGREEMARQEEAELAIIQEYLPKQMDAQDLRRIVSEAIAEAGATSPKEMGAVMKLVMPRVKGAADGKLVNQIVADLLGRK